MSDEKSWTAERVALAKKTVCPSGITDVEFELFMSQCKRSGLDPFLKECFCVPRTAGGVKKHEFQAAESGMLRRAEEFPDYRGVMAAAVYAGDAIDIDAGAGMVRHTFSPAGKRGNLIGAWAKLSRENRLPIVVWLDLAAYQQNTPTWSRMPATMMEKCARVGALRKGYPAAFGGVYIPEEMEGDDEPRAILPLSQQMAATAPAQSRTEALKGQLRTKQLAAKTAKLEVEVKPAPPSEATVLFEKGQWVGTPPAAKPLEPERSGSPIENILKLGKAYGKTQKQMGSIIKRATGKARPSQLDANDVALVHDALTVMRAQEKDEEPPPPGDEDAPFEE